MRGWMPGRDQGRYARRMAQERAQEHTPSAVLLLLDTCSERASLALFRGEKLVSEAYLEERTASSALLCALRSNLAASELTVRDLSGVGVVSGPGSFTGVRVGLALAKGLCEAAALPFAAVSRLAVLAEAAGLRDGLALLDAGRGQVYAREVGRADSGREWLTDAEALRSEARGRPLAVTATKLAELLAPEVTEVKVVELSARHAFGAVRRCLAHGGTEIALADANYVRNEGAIYTQRRTEPKLNPVSGERT